LPSSRIKMKNLLQLHVTGVLVAIENVYKTSGGGEYVRVCVVLCASVLHAVVLR
jgi:hypothetical protein